MKIKDIQELLSAEIICNEEGLDREIHTACGKLYSAGLRGGSGK